MLISRHFIIPDVGEVTARVYDLRPAITELRCLIINICNDELFSLNINYLLPQTMFWLVHHLLFLHCCKKSGNDSSVSQSLGKSAPSGSLLGNLHVCVRSFLPRMQNSSRSLNVFLFPKFENRYFWINAPDIFTCLGSCWWWRRDRWPGPRSCWGTPWSRYPRCPSPTTNHCAHEERCFEGSLIN